MQLPIRDPLLRQSIRPMVCGLVGGALLCGAPAFGAVSVDAVSAALRAEVAARLEKAESDVVVGFPGLTAPLDCAESSTLQVQASPGERFRGHPNLRLRVTEPDGRVCADLRLRPELRLYGQVPVAANAVGAGAPVTVQMERVALDRVDGALIPVGDAPEASGPWEARGPLQRGQPLTLSRVRATPAGRQGAEVLLVASSGPLRVQAAGRLLDDVALGGEVRVTNLATGVVVNGVLVEPGVVRAGARP
jgi:flagella basal body P-ring formation protein FlgA